MIDTRAIAHTLETRGVRLNPGIALSELTALGTRRGLSIDPWTRELYMTFNGFQTGYYDPGSVLHMWPLERVLRSQRDNLPGDTRRVAFADLLIGPNEYSMDLCDAGRPIYFDGKVIADGLPSFWTKIFDGTFDF